MYITVQEKKTRIIFQGQKEIGYRFLRKIYGHSVQLRSTTLISSIKMLILYPHNTLLILTLPSFFRYFLRWWTCIIPVSIEFSTKTNIYETISSPKSYRRNRNCMLREKYHYEVYNDTTMLKYFYDHLYIPFTTNRFGEESFTMSYSEMKKILESGHLVLVRSGNDFVSGVLIDQRWRKPQLKLLGINADYYDKKASFAAYYYSLQWLKSKHIVDVSLGWSYPFKNDGIVRFKKMWGANVSKSNWKSIFIFSQSYLEIEKDIYKGNDKQY